METLSPSLFMGNSNWFDQKTEWTREENKRFESALAIFDEHEPNRWLKVAAFIPGKTVYDVMRQYKELEDDITNIEAGMFPFPGYPGSSFTLELVDDDHRDFDAYRKRPLNSKSADHERKKGVPWTVDEHRRFLMGLLKHGKGDWRSIAHNFVVSKTPTQVASHAQKYFLRQQLAGVKDKRRPSIHDITTFNLTEPAVSDDNQLPSVDKSDSFSMDRKSGGLDRVLTDWNQLKDELLSDSIHGNDHFMSSPYGIASDGLKLPGQNLYAGAYHGARINPHSLVFQMPSTRHRIRG